MLGLVGDLEWVVDLVLGHGDQVDLRVREVRPGGSVDISEKLGDLSDTVGSVVEEEDVVTIYCTSAMNSEECVSEVHL